MDPAQAYNKLLIEKNVGHYQQIGNFRVIGTSYLFGEDQIGNVYTSQGSATNVSLRYNTYSQKVEIIQPDRNKYLSKGVEEVDSFLLIKDNANQHGNMNFINSKFIDSSEFKYFLNVLVIGKSFNLYKSLELSI